MKVIAKKHKYAENNYKIALMVSCGMIFMSAVMTIMSLCEYDGLSKEIAYISIPLGICAIIFTILYLLMEFIPAIKIPQDIISVDEDMGEIFLHPDKITIMARDVKSISCERSTRGASKEYSFGKITIQVGYETYEYVCVDNHSKVEKELNRIVELHKLKGNK